MSALAGWSTRPAVVTFLLAALKCFQLLLHQLLSNYHYVISCTNVFATSFPGPFSNTRKYPVYGWSRVYACQPNPHRGWVLNLILSTFSREVIVGLLYGQYFKKEKSYLSEILPGQLLRLYLNFYEYEMLIEKELCLYSSAFLNNRQQPASD